MAAMRKQEPVGSFPAKINGNVTNIIQTPHLVGNWQLAIGEPADGDASSSYPTLQPASVGPRHYLLSAPAAKPQYGQWGASAAGTIWVWVLFLPTR